MERVEVQITGTIYGFLNPNETVEEARIRIAYNAEHRINKVHDLRAHISLAVKQTCASHKFTSKVAAKFQQEQQQKQIDKIIKKLTTKDGLLYRDGQLVNVPCADLIAQDCGFPYAGYLIKYLEEK